MVLAGHDQQRAAVGVLGVDLGLRPRVQVGGCGLKRDPEPGTANVSYSSLASSSLTAFADA